MEIAEALRITRYEAGRSQETMAFELGVSRRTVQNWESGRSEPSIGKAIRWFQVLDKNPIPYLLQVIIPTMDHISGDDDDDKLRGAMHRIVDELPMEGVRQLLYLFFGDHGSSPRAIMQLVTAHLQTPMHNRVTQAGVVLHNYEMARRKSRVARPDHVQPDLQFLKEAIAAGEEAVCKDVGEYSVSSGRD